MFVGQLDQFCSQQMLMFATLINIGSWRGQEMGRGFEQHLPKERLLVCAPCRSCEAVCEAVGLMASHSLSGEEDRWDPNGNFGT